MSDTIIVQPTVYELTVTAPGPQGPIGPEGPAGTSTGYFEYNQIAPANVWTITHDLGYNPATTVTDSAGNVVEGTLLYLDTNTLEITFGIAISGYAYMS